MLQQLSDVVRHCYRRAGESRRRAETAPNPSTAETYYQLEQGWLRLAESCQLSQRVSAFLQSVSISKYVVARPATLEWRDISTVPFDCEVEVSTLDDDTRQAHEQDGISPAPDTTKRRSIGRAVGRVPRSGRSALGPMAVLSGCCERR